LFVLCLSLGSFLFSFPLFSFFVRASVMACIVGREGCYHDLLSFPLNRDEGDEQFALKRRRFELKRSFFNLATGIMISCNQALIHGKFFFFFLIWPLDQFQFLILFLIVFYSKN
jgi:hypothetical protein